MKKETILDILSAIVVCGAILFNLLSYKKETGEFSIRSLLMDSSQLVTNIVYDE